MFGVKNNRVCFAQSVLARSLKCPVIKTAQGFGLIFGKQFLGMDVEAAHGLKPWGMSRIAVVEQ